MGEYEHVYREALEAAAQACLLRKGFDGPPLDHPFDKGYLAACDACVKDIRSLASRIAAPDDEALVETVAQALWEHGAMSFAPWCEANALERQGYVAEARAVLLAIREAGALRHE